jgi:hypothetical protein
MAAATWQRGLAVGVVLLAASAALAGADAQAAAPSDDDTTVAHVQVSPAISITVDPADFYLSGAPGDVPTADVAVTVATNNATGYSVSLDAPAQLTHTNGTDAIEINRLELRVGAVGTFGPLAAGVQPQPVGTATGPTTETGTTATHTYRMTLPTVPSGEYTGTLTYTATANVP